MDVTSSLSERMSELIFTLRQKCALKDLYFVKKLGISIAEFNALVQFFTHDALGVKELAEKLDITPGGVTRIVTSLEEKGLVLRKISPEDRRSVDVFLTETGKDMVQQIRQTSLELHAKILEQIEPQFRQPVVDAIERLIEAIDKWIEVHEDELNG